MFESRFQSFTETADPQHGRARAAALRDELRNCGLHGFIVPRADEHQNEYVPPAAERLAWLTGFTGSAGLAIVLRDEAAIFIDGRYTIQVREQVDVKVFKPVAIMETSPEAWLEAHVSRGERIGYDPWLHTPGQIRRLSEAARAAGASLVPVDTNPVDHVWEDRPQPPMAPIRLHPKRFSGEDAAAKIARVEAAMQKMDALLVSDPHAVAWLFNIRGQDVAHTPLPLAFALLRKGHRPALYVEAGKVSEEVRGELGDLCEIAEPWRLSEDVRRMGEEGLSVRFDAATAPVKLTQILEGAGGHADPGADPIALMKARKNASELKGARAAHLRDGVAVTRFLAWFSDASRRGRLTEIAAAQALETFRRDTRRLKDVSFPTISGAGPNSALPHYRVSESSNRAIVKGLFLIDSGAQYEDGTTDITRTLAVGKPTAEMRDRFTRVLKGHIAIARAVFPKGTAGSQIDALARLSLWQAGLDFDHGTGHGVGSYLSVHEGPQRISKTGGVALEPGMFLSNEPGYYKAGAWGIRIENLVVVRKAKIDGAERDMLEFETLTLAPIDLALVEPKLLTREETIWLNAYHARVRAEVSPLLDRETQAWLRGATRKIGQ
ncbi:MAG: aminopeptidase P family protein [Beijerinckiaceae bacterium]|nr:aminopeptidase P family protein [Beijerinckiaceae bacterium]